MTATCPHCADELDIPAEFAGRPVRCGNCQSVFTPPSPVPLPTASPRADTPQSPLWEDAEDRPRKSSRRTRDADEDSDDAPPPPRSNAGVWGLAFLTLLLTAPCTVGCVWMVVVFGFPEFRPVTDDTGRFEAAFPGDPLPVNRKDEDGRLVRGLDLNREFPPEKYFVYYADPPKAAGKDPQAVLAEAAKQLDEFVTPGAKEVEREPATHDGFPALDLMLDADGGQPGAVIVRLVLAKSPAGTPRLYVVGVAGPLGPDDTRAKRFFKGFKVAGEK